jgi:hypothetical protein
MDGQQLVPGFTCWLGWSVCMVGVGRRLGICRADVSEPAGRLLTIKVRHAIIERNKAQAARWSRAGGFVWLEKKDAASKINRFYRRTMEQ